MITTGARLFVTVNGPGELMGWVRPFLQAMYCLAPDARVTGVVLPCAYATGQEGALLQSMFPKAEIVDRQAYARFLLGRPVAGMQRTSGALQYLGGDLFHAVTIAKRLGLTPMTYKFTRKSYANVFARFFAVDEENAHRLRSDGAPPDRVRVVGNLVADAVLQSLRNPPQEPGIGNGVCIMPGSRSYEVKYLTPFFLAVARELVRLRPNVQITFLFSAFNGVEQLREGIEHQGDPRLFGIAGRFDPSAGTIDVDGARFKVDRGSDYRAMAAAQLVVSIPGTKLMEAAVLGRAMLAVVPTNRLDEVAMNGLAAYLHYIPLIGPRVHARVARAVERRIRFMAQPNIDAGRLVVPEVRGILQPAEVAAQAAALLDQPDRLQSMGRTVAQLYATHAGAAERMAQDALSIASRASAQPIAV